MLMESLPAERQAGVLRVSAVSDVGRGVTVHCVSRIGHVVESVLRSAEAGSSIAVESAALYRAAPAAGVAA